MNFELATHRNESRSIGNWIARTNCSMADSGMRLIRGGDGSPPRSLLLPTRCWGRAAPTPILEAKLGSLPPLLAQVKLFILILSIGEASEGTALKIFPVIYRRAASRCEVFAAESDHSCSMRVGT